MKTTAPDISTKAASYNLYDSGFFGNKLRTWNSPAALIKSKFAGKVCARYKGAGGGAAYPSYGVPISPDQVPALVVDWVARGAKPDKVVFNENAPDQDLTIQGEVMLTPDGIALYFSTDKTTMRRALAASGKQVFGMEAIALLKRNLTPGSYSDIMELLETFPTAVVEFAAYKYCVGDCRGRNAVIWEVRNY